MLAHLQRKWKLSPGRLAMVLLCFALGGSLCGWASRQLLALSGVSGLGRWLVYALLLTATWPFCVLAVGHLLGQGRFFRNYLARIFARMTRQQPWSELEPTGPHATSSDQPGAEKHTQPMDNAQARLAIFASGGGSNARVLMDHFAGHPQIQVALLVSNRAAAGALALAAERGVPTLVIQKQTFVQTGYLAELQARGITHLVLAGFLLQVPTLLVAAFPERIVNIHPALLPRFGGKGMWGHHVHAAVLAAGCRESGVTIHLVDEHYDHGKHLFQASCPVLPTDTVEALAARVLELEHRHYAPVVEAWVLGKTKGR